MATRPSEVRSSDGSAGDDDGDDEFLGTGKLVARKSGVTHNDKRDEARLLKLSNEDLLNNKVSLEYKLR